MSQRINDLAGIGEIIRQIRLFVFGWLKYKQTIRAQELEDQAQELKNEEQALKNLEMWMRLLPYTHKERAEIKKIQGSLLVEVTDENTNQLL